MDQLSATRSFQCPAKINLFLHLTGRRADGYHTLESVFRSVSLFDEITLNVRNDGQILRSFGPANVRAEHDLTLRAAALLQKTSCTDFGVDISLSKRIPLGAGLGGGSSNAAGVLQNLNALWRCDLSQTALYELALQLGADVPFFLSAGDQFVRGIGEQLVPLALPHAHYLIVYPGVNCTTGPMFQQPALVRNSAPVSFVDLAQQDLLSAGFTNAFEATALSQYPEIARAKQWLIQQAGNARLSGSGSALFAKLSSAAQAKQIQACCPMPWQAWAVQSTANNGHSYAL